jgi:hypothetical protein
VPNSKKNIFNNQQGLVVAMEGSGGLARMGTDDDGGHIVPYRRR